MFGAGAVCSSRNVAVRSLAMTTALSMGVCLGTLTCVGYNLYLPDVLSPPVDGMENVKHL
eukprot:scaffold315908_cov35-Attheya_sp.AAC.1